MLWQAGLQLEVAQRIVTAARKEVLGHSATLVICYAGLQLQVAKCILTAARREELGCRSCRRASSRRSSPDKRLLREVAETRGTSAKRLLNEEVAPQRSSSLIHPFIGSASDSLAHQLTNLLVDSLIH